MAMSESAEIEYGNKKNKLIQEFLKVSKSHQIGLGKNTSNLFRNRNASTKKINVKQFNQVIAVDKQNLTADIEAMATYETIVNETLKYHCLPTVVPELKSITIGGALTGGGIESSSFRFGLVHETILSFEVLLSSGEVILCAPDNEHRELFFGFPNSYGTLGYVLRVKVKLIPVKKYVKLQHIQYHDSQLYFADLKKLCLQNRLENKIAYIDGVVFKSNEMVMTTGEFVDEVPFVSNYTFLKIFFKSIQHKKIDYLTTHDYIWRWDTDWFWCSKHFYMQNFLMRVLFGKWLLNSKAFWKLRKIVNQSNFLKKILFFIQGNVESVIQDIEVPVENADNFLQFFQKEIGIKPIWICPTMPYKDNIIFTFYPMNPSILYINFGFWDVVPSKQEDGYFNRLIEENVLALDGFKSLYSTVYFTKEKFWEIYNYSQYKFLKNQYDSSYRFNDLYTKVIEK